MKSIEEQIEALTQELRPYPEWERQFYAFDGDSIESSEECGDEDILIKVWQQALYASTNKAEVEEYADCYRRLKLYQLLGKKAEKEFPVIWRKTRWNTDSIINHGTDFFQNEHILALDMPEDNRNRRWQNHLQPKIDAHKGLIRSVTPTCVLGGVWFAREEDRLEALKICGITKELQEKCSKYGLG